MYQNDSETERDTAAGKTNMVLPVDECSGKSQTTEERNQRTAESGWPCCCHFLFRF